jgi:hypothetical protein
VEEEANCRTTPIGMFHFAHSYALSASKLNDDRIRATHPDAPIRFLFCHAIELYFKSYRLLKGVTIEELKRRNYGHDLERLLRKSVELGLTIPKEHEDWVGIANQAIRDRYIETGFRTVVLPEALLGICSGLNAQIGPLVYKKAGMARKPAQF